MQTLRKIDRMHALFGRCEGHTCGECSNFVSGRYHDKILRKCSVYGLTHSEASDWAKSYTACGMFNKTYVGKPVLRMAQHQKAKTPKPPMDGQMEL